MAFKARRVFLVAKLELLVGTDSTPAGANDGVVANITNVQPLQAETAQRENIRPYFGSFGAVTVGTSSLIEFEIELASSGAAGTAPAWKALMQACGTSENISAGVSVTYAPVDTGQKTISIYYEVDGLRHKFIGCRGNARLELNAKRIPKVKFTFIGTYTPPSDTSIGAVTLTAWKDPLPVNNTNTPTWSLHSTALKAQSFTLDFGNQNVIRNLVGLDSVDIIDRRSTGSMVFEMTTVAAKAWHESVRTNATGALSIIHGVGAGNITEIAATKVQISNSSYSEQDGVTMIGVDLSFIPTSGNDEWAIISR